jgi:putative ubiquitin-RnfH superfamily antitoxin RatB of RatAB toxin-antitoxin module
VRVSVAIALPGRQEVVDLDLPDGADLQAALDAARVAERYPDLDAGRCEVGIWGRVCPRDTRLRQGDRVELYRPLAADAKAMRRQRAKVRPSTRSRNAP